MQTMDLLNQPEEKEVTDYLTLMNSLTLGKRKNREEIPLSVIAGSHQKNKTMTSLDRSQVCDTNSQTQTSSKISVVDSISKEKDLKPFWNDACRVISSHLLSHTEIDSVGLGLKSLNTLSTKMVEKSWFSTNLTHHQNLNLPQTSLQSFMSSLAVCTDSEGTLTKSRRIRIYPTKEQKIRFKGWFGVSRLFYNNTIDHYNNPDKDTINWMGVAKGLTDRLCEDYVKTTPYQVKKIAVKDGYQSFITNVRKTKKTGRGFKLGFRSKKNPVQSCYIPKTAVKDEGIYHTIAGKLKYSERLGLVNKDCRLIYDNGRWFISIPTEYGRKMFIENQEDIIAIDPGVRSFVSLFSAKGVYGHIGKTDFSTIQRLCDHMDKLISRMTLEKNKLKKDSMRRALMRVRHKLRDLTDELHNKVIMFLVKNFKVVVYPEFDVSNMVVKGRRRLNRKSARNMLNWGFYKFSEKLKRKCDEYGVKLIRICEAYTSRTNSFTGEVMNIGSKKQFTYMGKPIDRDINGARNILIRALRDGSATSWDTGGCLVQNL